MLDQDDQPARSTERLEDLLAHLGAEVIHAGYNNGDGEHLGAGGTDGYFVDCAKRYAALPARPPVELFLAVGEMEGDGSVLPWCSLLNEFY